jgi:hypothetical protein
MNTSVADGPYLAAVSQVAAATTPAPIHTAPRLGSLRSFVSRLLVDVNRDATTVDVTGAATQLPLSPYDAGEPARPTKIQPGRDVTGESSSPPPTTSRTGETP